MRIVNPTAVLGEDAACTFLQRKQYQIIERNFRKGYGEIDIIALHNNVLVFIEVKTRSSSAFGSTFESITSSKIRSLLHAAKYYKYILHPELPDALRVDAIGVQVWGNEVLNIEHLENITGF